jgi:hypothetical protein
MFMSMVKDSDAIYFVLTVFRQQILPSLLAISSQQALTSYQIYQQTLNTISKENLLQRVMPALKCNRFWQSRIVVKSMNVANNVSHLVSIYYQNGIMKYNICLLADHNYYPTASVV